jgi:hypothetical protein
MNRKDTNLSAHVLAQGDQEPLEDETDALVAADDEDDEFDEDGDAEDDDEDEVDDEEEEKS